MDSIAQALKTLVEDIGGEQRSSIEDLGGEHRSRIEVVSVQLQKPALNSHESSENVNRCDAGKRNKHNVWSPSRDK